MKMDSTDFLALSFHRGPGGASVSQWHAHPEVFLHLSKDEQAKRFRDRIDEPDKNWKFCLADVKERGKWDDYMKAYEACLSATSTEIAPWHIIPADDKENARLILSQTILDTLNGLKMSYPQPDAARLEELKAIRKEL